MSVNTMLACFKKCKFHTDSQKRPVCFGRFHGNRQLDDNCHGCGYLCLECMAHFGIVTEDVAKSAKELFRSVVDNPQTRQCPVNPNIHVDKNGNCPIGYRCSSHGKEDKIGDDKFCIDGLVIPYPKDVKVPMAIVIPNKFNKHYGEDIY